MPQAEKRLAGVEALAAVTGLLQRARCAHPTAALYEAADLQFWWRIPRSTDTHPQLFWFDDQGEPEAAVVAVDWGDLPTSWSDEIMLVPVWLPGARPEFDAHVVERGLAWAAESGFGAVEFEVETDSALATALAERGFTVARDGVVEAWLDVDTRPAVSDLANGYRLATRPDLIDQPHHWAATHGPDTEARLLQGSLYRPDLDLVALDATDQLAGYGLCWHDPISATALIEPMRTHDEHQRRGIARHILTAGIDRLANAGAQRIKICYEADNPASSTLYTDVGFTPLRQTVVMR